MSKEDIRKTILITIPNDHFEFMKDIVTSLFQKSGFKNFNFNKKIDFEELYKQQFAN